MNFLKEEIIIKEFDLESDLDGLKRIKGASREISNLIFENTNKEKEFLLCIDEIFSNCIIHAYKKEPGKVNVKFYVSDEYLKINIKDYGIGIPIKYTREIPKLSENLLSESGKGLVIVNNICDDLIIKHNENSGTEVIVRFKKGE